MSGTRDGGLAAAGTNKELYGADYYQKIGAQGGKKGKTGGFYTNRELARIAGRLGGTISSRSRNKKPFDKKRNARLKREYLKAYRELTKYHNLADRQRKKLAKRDTLTV